MSDDIPDDETDKKARMKARLKARKEQKKNAAKQRGDVKPQQSTVSTSTGIDPSLFAISKVGDYKLLTLLGKGGAGTVHKGVNIQTGQYVAVKRINLHGVGQSEREAMEIEIDLLKRFKHPNIVQYLETIQIAGSLNIILELVDGGTLNDQLANFAQRPDRLIAYYLIQVLRGLEYLHDQGIIHRDIKGANLLSNKDGIVKLADFGVAKQLGKVLKTHSVVGTPYWMAPEIIQMSAKQSCACDIWSVGCTVLELLTGKPPFFDSNPMSALYKMVQCDHPPFPDGLAPDLVDFLLCCLQRDPTKRATAGELLQHRWLKIDMNEGEDLARASVILQQQKWRERQEASERKKTMDGAGPSKHQKGTLSKTLDRELQLVNMEDMVGMERMTADLVLANIKVRFHRDLIYTNIGSILIAVNPYREIDGLYSEKMYAKYHYTKPVHTVELGPHIFKISKAAYWGATALDLPKGVNRNQAILISGESGAGKTEATKLILSYITKMTAPQAGKNLNALLAEDAIKSIEDKLLQANPILEAFGNAKTLRNDNSSRFGKWVTITLAAKRRTDIYGASIVKYLLEESRVCVPTVGERNYNIFYQVCANIRNKEPGLAKEYDPLAFSYLTAAPNDSQSVAIKGVDDNAAFQGVVQAMWCLGIEEQDRAQIVDIIKGILNLGNVTFIPKQGTAGSAVSPATMPFLDKAAHLFGLAPEVLREALVVKVRVVKGVPIKSDWTPPQAVAVRDSIAKALYGRMFTWLVSRINQAIARSADIDPNALRKGLDRTKSAIFESSSSLLELELADLAPLPTPSLPHSHTHIAHYSMQTIHPQHSNQAGHSQGLGLGASGHGGHGHNHAGHRGHDTSSISLDQDSPGATIGILDIFGFEAFDTNSFEQLCINFANEQLQQFFIHFIFKMEQALYKEEALNVDKMPYTDNKDCVDLLGGKLGVFAMLADEMNFPQGSDITFLGKLHQQHEKHAFYEKPLKTHGKCFSIRHYPQQVTYDVTGFLEKNRAAIGEDVVGVFLASSCSLAVTLFGLDPDGEGDDDKEKDKIKASQSVRKKNKPMGLGSQFQESLKSLLASLSSATPHFVRCIKPNASKQPLEFDQELVLRQLRTSGMLDSVTVRKLGYADRIEHRAFLARYEQQYIRKYLRQEQFQLPVIARKVGDVVVEEEEGKKEEEKDKEKEASEVSVNGGGGGGGVGGSKTMSAEEAEARVQAFKDKDQRGRISEILDTVSTIVKNKFKSKLLNQQMELWQLGVTKVFFKPEIYRELEADRAGLLFHSVLCMQRFIRGYLARSRLRDMLITLKKLNNAVGDADLQAIDLGLLEATRAGLAQRMVNSFWDQRQHIERTLKNCQEVVDALASTVPSLAVRLASLSLAINKCQLAQLGYSDAQGSAFLAAAKTILGILTKFMRNLTILVDRCPQLDGVGAKDVTELIDDMTASLDGVFRRVKAEEWGLSDEELESMIKVLVGQGKDVEEVANATHKLTEVQKANQAITAAMDIHAYDLDTLDFGVMIGKVSAAMAAGEAVKLNNKLMDKARGCVEALKVQTALLQAQQHGVTFLPTGTSAMNAVGSNPGSATAQDSVHHAITLIRAAHEAQKQREQYDAAIAEAQVQIEAHHRQLLQEELEQQQHHPPSLEHRPSNSRRKSQRRSQNRGAQGPSQGQSQGQGQGQGSPQVGTRGIGNNKNSLLASQAAALEPALQRRRSKRISALAKGLVPPLPAPIPSLESVNEWMAASKNRIQPQSVGSGDKGKEGHAPPVDLGASSLDDALRKIESLSLFVSKGVGYGLALRELLNMALSVPLDAAASSNSAPEGGDASGNGIGNGRRAHRGSIGVPLHLLHEVKAYISTPEELSHVLASPALVSLYHKAETMLASHATSRLLHALASGDPESLEAAIRTAQKANLPQDEIRQASRRLTYLTLKREINNAMDTHDGDALQRALHTLDERTASQQVDGSLLKATSDQARKVGDVLTYLTNHPLPSSSNNPFLDNATEFDAEAALNELSELVKAAKHVGVADAHIAPGNERIIALQALAHSQSQAVKAKQEAEQLAREKKEEEERLEMVRLQMERAENERQAEEREKKEKEEREKKENVERIKKEKEEREKKEAEEREKKEKAAVAEKEANNNNSNHTSNSNADSNNNGKTTASSPQTASRELSPTHAHAQGANGNVSPKGTASPNNPSSPSMANSKAALNAAVKAFAAEARAKKQSPQPAKAKSFTHWPAMVEQQGPCRMCKKSTQFQCKKCNGVFLCPAPCLEKYHSQ